MQPTQLFNEAFSGTVQYVRDGDCFDLGNKTIEVKHMPAHTPGSIVLIDIVAGNCFTGDAFGPGCVWLQLWPNSPMQAYIHACKQMEPLMDKGIERIYCGHYPYVERTYSKEYIKAMRKLAEALENGTAPKAAPFSIIIPDVGPANPMIVSQGEVSIIYDPEYIK